MNGPSFVPLPLMKSEQARRSEAIAAFTHASWLAHSLEALLLPPAPTVIAHGGQ